METTVLAMKPKNGLSKTLKWYHSLSRLTHNGWSASGFSPFSCIFFTQPCSACIHQTRWDRVFGMTCSLFTYLSES